jgi:hypothetical protein
LNKDSEWSPWTDNAHGGGLFTRTVRSGPEVVTIAPVVRIELARVEALELLAMTLAHLNVAEARAEMTPRVPMLMGLRDKLAFALREENDT